MKAYGAAFLAVALAAAPACGSSTPDPGGGDAKVKHMESGGRTWLGVSVRDVTAEIAKDLGLKAEEGAHVVDVVKKSPADSAGVKEGDVILEFNGRKIYDADDLVKAVRKTEVGTKAKVVVKRKGEEKELYVTTKMSPRRSSSFAFAPRDLPHRIHLLGGPRLGMSLVPLNPQLGAFFEAPDGKGLLVEKVEEGSPAEKAGFKAGDIIVKAGNKQVSKVHEFRSELAEYEKGEKVNIEILRKGTRKTVTVEIDENDDGFEFFMGDVPELPEEIEVPDVPEVDRFDLHWEDLRPELDRLKMQLEQLRRRIEEGRGEFERWIRQEFLRERMTTEV